MTAERFREPDVLIPAEASVGEGPVIDHHTGRLCWVDIIEGILYENDVTDRRQTVTTLGTMVGAVAPREQSEGFAVAVADGFGYWASGQLAIADPVLPEAHRRMNDAKCDSRGRLWAGSTHMQFVPGIGALHRWDGGPSSATMAAGLTLPNGLGWNQEDTIMYLIDSMNTTSSAPPSIPTRARLASSPPCARSIQAAGRLGRRPRRFDLGRHLGRGGGAPLRPHRHAHRDHSNASHPADQLCIRSRRNPLHNHRTGRPTPQGACEPATRRVHLRAPDQHPRRPRARIRCLTDDRASP